MPENENRPEGERILAPHTAAEDLSSSLQLIAQRAAAGTVEAADAEGVPLGWLANEPESGRSAFLAISESFPGKVGEAMSAGDLVRPNASAKGVKAKLAGERVCGVMTQDSSADGETPYIFPVHGYNAPAIDSGTAAVSKAADATLTVAECLYRRILGDPAGAAITLTSPTAALLVAGGLDAVGKSFVTLIHNADDTDVVKLAYGSGVTPVSSDGSPHFLMPGETAVIRWMATNVTASSEAVKAVVSIEGRDYRFKGFTSFAATATFTPVELFETSVKADTSGGVVTGTTPTGTQLSALGFQDGQGFRTKIVVQGGNAFTLAAGSGVNLDNMAADLAFADDETVILEWTQTAANTWSLLVIGPG